MRVAIAAGIMVGWLALPALAAPARPAPRPALEQLEIQGRTTEYDGASHTYRVKGDVTIETRDLVVTCKEAVIYTTPGEDRVDRIVFTGNVEARRGTGVFRGERVVYHVAQRKLQAEGMTRTRLLVPGAPLPTPRPTK